jgi:hypothetical protein
MLFHILAYPIGVKIYMTYKNNLIQLDRFLNKNDSSMSLFFIFIIFNYARYTKIKLLV